MQTQIEGTTTLSRLPAGAAAERQQRRLTTRSALAFAAMAILSACASSGPVAPTAQAAATAPAVVEKRAEFRAIPQGSAILVIGRAARFDDGSLNGGKNSTTPKRSGGRVAGQAAAGTAGAVGGAVLGAGGGLIAGIVACGPMAIVCAPLAAVVGAVGGGAGGAAMGIGLTRGKPVKRTKTPPLPAALGDVASEVAGNLLKSQPLVDAFEREADGYWIVGAGKGTTGVVLLEIEEFFFSPGNKETYTLEVVSSMTVAYAQSDSEAETTVPLRLRYVSAPHSVEEWVAEDGAVVRAELDAALTRHASVMTQMVKDPRADLNAEL